MLGGKEVIGVDEFGASGHYLETFEKFGFTVENIRNAAETLLC